MAKETKNLEDIKTCYQKLGLIYEKIGDEDKSNSFFKKYGHLADSLAQINKSAVKTSSDLIVSANEREYSAKKMRYVIIIIAAILLLILLVYILYKFRKRHQQTVNLHKLKQDQLYQKLAFLNSKNLTDKVDEGVLKEVVGLAMANDPAFMLKFKEAHPVFI